MNSVSLSLASNGNRYTTIYLTIDGRRVRLIDEISDLRDIVNNIEQNGPIGIELVNTINHNSSEVQRITDGAPVETMASLRSEIEELKNTVSQLSEKITALTTTLVNVLGNQN